MTFSIRLRTLVLPLRDPFVIARSSHGEGRTSTTILAELRDDADGPDGPVGLGEGYPDTYYGETPATVAAVVPLLLESLDPLGPALRGSLDDARTALVATEGAMAAAIGSHGGAKCAVDIALHDLVGKRLGLPIRSLLGIDA
ncbi:MAG: hypothetical protein MUQ32_09540, partial [Chloroflexi bacterium]|nr:hypothetical protein [Chloroflexota bacterium]